MNKQVLFYNGLIFAQKTLRDNIDAINQINVFPVADGDTGSNLLMSLEDNHLSFNENYPIKSQIKLFAEALFQKASGNSGFICSLLFTALAQHIEAHDTFQPVNFAHAMQLAVRESINEIEDYVDGSMLSFAEALALLMIESGFKHWDKALYHFLDNAIQSILKETSLKNPILSSSRVIDAGSLGLSIWFMALFSSLCEMELQQHSFKKSSSIENNVGCDEALTHGTPNYRYCVQATLGNINVDVGNINNLLHGSGDCSLKITHGSAMRFHIHTDKPQTLFPQLMRYSTVQDVKIDDMKMQYHAINTNQKIAIVTDSSADISNEHKEKHKIHVIPLSITQGAQKMLDGLTINPESLGDLIEGNTDYPKTASPSPGNISKTLSFLSKHYKKVIAITISSGMSATYRAFSKAAADHSNVYVINSKRNSAAHGFVVTEIAALIEKGNTIEKIINMAERIITSKNIYVMVNNFSAMLKSGRVSRSKAWIADIINLKPVVGIDRTGQGIVLSKTFSQQAQFNALISLLKKQDMRSKIKGFITLYVGDQEQASKLNKKIANILNVKSYGILHASPVISLHAGQGALAVAIDQEI